MKRSKTPPKTPPVNIVHNPFALSVWTGPFTSTSQPYDRGYDVIAGDLAGNNNANLAGLQSQANGAFSDGFHCMPLFINQLDLSIALSGITAQSQLTRDFYPHNLTLPNYSIGGQCASQGTYGLLCEFVHAMQRATVSNTLPGVTYTGHPGTLIQFYLKGNRYPGVTGNRKSGPSVTVNGQPAFNQSIKGQYQDIICQGYIMSVPRSHKTGDYIPTWSISFMVAQMIKGPFQDQLIAEKQTASWFDLLHGAGAVKLDTPANLKENKQILANAAANQGSAISSQAA